MEVTVARTGASRRLIAESLDVADKLFMGASLGGRGQTVECGLLLNHCKHFVEFSRFVEKPVCAGLYAFVAVERAGVVGRHDNLGCGRELLDVGVISMALPSGQSRPRMTRVGKWHRTFSRVRPSESAVWTAAMPLGPWMPWSRTSKEERISSEARRGEGAAQRKAQGFFIQHRSAGPLADPAQIVLLPLGNCVAKKASRATMAAIESRLERKAEPVWKIFIGLSTQ